VAAGYSGDTDRAKAFVGDFARQFGPARITVHRGNVANPADCQRVVQEVIAEHGRLDILVNNAGVTADKLAVDLTTAEWDKVLDVNLSGAFHMAQAAPGPHARAGHRADHQRVLAGRRDRQHRPGQLRRVQVRAVRADQGAPPGKRRSSCPGRAG